MLTGFRPQRKQPQPTPAPDLQTGEVPMGPSSLALPQVPPDFSKIKSLADKIGKQPEYINLKDHPELSGKQIGIVAVKFNPGGEFGPYVTMGVFILDQNKKPENGGLVIVTGAQNVLDRLMPVMGTINQGEPLIATLRAVPGTKGSDAWLLD